MLQTHRVRWWAMQVNHSGYQNLTDIAPLDVVNLRESLWSCQPQKWIVSHQDSSDDHSQLRLHFRSIFRQFLCDWRWTEITNCPCAQRWQDVHRCHSQRAAVAAGASECCSWDVRTGSGTAAHGPAHGKQGLSQKPAFLHLCDNRHQDFDKNLKTKPALVTPQWKAHPKPCQGAHGGDKGRFGGTEGLRALPRVCCPQQRPPPRRAGPRRSPCSRWRSWRSGATRQSRSWCHKGPVGHTAGQGGCQSSLLCLLHTPAPWTCLGHLPAHSCSMNLPGHCPAHPCSMSLPGAPSCTSLLHPYPCLGHLPAHPRSMNLPGHHPAHPSSMPFLGHLAGLSLTGG